MANVGVLPNVNGNGVHPTNANGNTSPGRTSPTKVHFQPSTPFRDHSPHDSTPRTISDHRTVPERSLTSTSISEDIKSLSTDHHLTECCDSDCACGWETYVCDHACKVPEPPESQSKWHRISIHELLHQEEGNPLLREYAPGTIRHVHLPANNMTWVQDLILRYYHGKEEDKQYRLLRRDFWYGQQHGRKGPIHARFMRPRCDVVPANDNRQYQRPNAILRSRSPSPNSNLRPTDTAPSVREPHTKDANRKTPSLKSTPSALDDGHKDFVISMPYLHWETDTSREKMRAVIADVLEPNTYTLSGRRIPDLKLSNYGRILIPKLVTLARQKLAKSGMLDADERLLRKYVTHRDRPLHIRRTLDQSYYWTLKDTQARDRDQVVYRATEKADHQDARLVMVDQLWLWILDGKLVITSFPRRWGRKKSDASGIYRTIRERLDDRPNLDNVYDTALLMIDQCSRVFFDRTVPRDNRPDVIDMFANAIGDVTAKSTKAYLDFWELILPDSERYQKMLSRHSIWEVIAIKAKNSPKAKDPLKTYNDITLNTLLDINPEGELLKEIKDIQDELHMITKIFNEQHTVADDFSTFLQKLGGKSKEISQKTRDDAKQLVKEISRRRAEITELTKAAGRTADGLKELLDLKQKHANVSEARAGVQAANQALVRADEANKILEATKNLATESAKQTEQGVRQAEQSTKQNRSLMIFTIVTIIFLPLGFFSSVFGMNAPEFGQGEFHIWKQFLIMFPVSIAIISFSLAMALNEDLLTFFGTAFKLRWAQVLNQLGLLEKWKRKGERFDEIMKKQQEELKALYGDNGP